MPEYILLRPGSCAMRSAQRIATRLGGDAVCRSCRPRKFLRTIATAAVEPDETSHYATQSSPSPPPSASTIERTFESTVSKRDTLKTAKPFSDFLTDTFGRQHDYLRISVTERCNLRCLYCMPEEGIELSPTEKILTTPEIFYLSSLFVSQGVTKIRLTGGEPTVRKDIVELMHMIGSLRSKGLKELAITTNGISLHRKLDAMAEAGLTGVNLSLDTLDPFQFQIMTRRKGFDAVMRSIDRILEMKKQGAPIKLKINCVVMRGMNDREILPFVELGRGKDIEVRFIEYMPFDGNKWSQGKMFSYQEMLDLIRTKFPELRRVQDGKNDTSKTYEVPGFVGRIGFITSMTHNFCGTCNRLRITSNGNLKVCLFGNAEVSLRDMLRQGNDGRPIDEAAFEALKQLESNRHLGLLPADTPLGFGERERHLLDIIGTAVKRKKEKHAGMGELENMKNRPMILIGGSSAPSREPVPVSPILQTQLRRASARIANEPRGVPSAATRIPPFMLASSAPVGPAHARCFSTSRSRHLEIKLGPSRKFMRDEARRLQKAIAKGEGVRRIDYLTDPYEPSRVATHTGPSEAKQAAGETLSSKSNRVLEMVRGQRSPSRKRNDQIHDISGGDAVDPTHQDITVSLVRHLKREKDRSLTSEEDPAASQREDAVLDLMLQNQRADKQAASTKRDSALDRINALMTRLEHQEDGEPEEELEQAPELTITYHAAERVINKIRADQLKGQSVLRLNLKDMALGELPPDQLVQIEQRIKQRLLYLQRRKEVRERLRESGVNDVKFKDYLALPNGRLRLRPLGLVRTARDQSLARRKAYFLARRRDLLSPKTRGALHRSRSQAEERLRVSAGRTSLAALKARKRSVLGKQVSNASRPAIVAPGSTATYRPFRRPVNEAYRELAIKKAAMRRTITELSENTSEPAANVRLAAARRMAVVRQRRIQSSQDKAAESTNGPGPLFGAEFRFKDRFKQAESLVEAYTEAQKEFPPAASSETRDENPMQGQSESFAHASMQSLEEPKAVLARRRGEEEAMLSARREKVPEISAARLERKRGKGAALFSAKGERGADTNTSRSERSGQYLTDARKLALKEASHRRQAERLQARTWAEEREKLRKKEGGPRQMSAALLSQALNMEGESALKRHVRAAKCIEPALDLIGNQKQVTKDDLLLERQQQSLALREAISVIENVKKAISNPSSRRNPADLAFEFDELRRVKRTYAPMITPDRLQVWNEAFNYFLMQEDIKPLTWEEALDIDATESVDPSDSSKPSAALQSVPPSLSHRLASEDSDIRRTPSIKSGNGDPIPRRPSKVLCVHGLGPKTSAAPLKNVFSTQPGYEDLHLIMQRHRKICFVYFKDVQSATEMLEKLQGLTSSSVGSKECSIIFERGVRFDYSDSDRAFVQPVLQKAEHNVSTARSEDALDHGNSRLEGVVDETPFRNLKIRKQQFGPNNRGHSVMPQQRMFHASRSLSSKKPEPKDTHSQSLRQSSSAVSPQLTHVKPSGAAHMVSISGKATTTRTAIAVNQVLFSNPEAHGLVTANALKKGDVLSISRIAGIMAAKETSRLIPLCHPISLSHVTVELIVLEPSLPNTGDQLWLPNGGPHGSVYIEARCECSGQTGVEMEALTAATVAGLTVYDMCKAVDKGMALGNAMVVKKTGGKSGDWEVDGWKPLEKWRQPQGLDDGPEASNSRA